MKSIKKRFWNLVNKTKTCWNWIAYIRQDGYGVFWINNEITRARAHRVSWELTNGPIPNKMHVLHKCDNPSCVNPKHLFLGTPLDNMKDKVKKNRQSRLKGINNPASKLTENQVLEIRYLYSLGNTTHRKLAKQFNVGRTVISQAINKRTWKHI